MHPYFLFSVYKKLTKVKNKKYIYKYRKKFGTRVHTGANGTKRRQKMPLYRVKPSMGDTVPYLKRERNTYKRSNIETSVLNELLRRFDWRVNETYATRADGLMRVPLSFLVDTAESGE
jgi:hypothetical protein